MNLLGIDIGGTRTKLVQIDSGGEVSQRGEIDTQAAMGAAALGARIHQTISGWPKSSTAGLAVAGLLDSDRELVQAPNLEAFRGVDLAAAFADFGVATIENDVNCAVFGEWQVGAANGLQHVAMLSLGTGVGGGLILNGRLFHGAAGLAGEFGHMLLDPDGPICPCGLNGHVESWLGQRGFARAGREHAAAQPGSALAAAVAAGEDPQASVLARLAGEGCGASRAALAECGRWLGIACANLVAILQPECILIAGGSSRCGDLLLQPALDEYDRRCMEAARRTVPVRIAALGVESAAIGAALLAGANLDADPAAGR
ncbi:hypothetical protein DRQ53_02770 [bacterium]|nr:MAG: hypothetical protein DRQ53_02770 [bacterium]